MERKTQWLLVADTGVWLLFNTMLEAQEWRNMAWRNEGRIVKVLDFPSKG